MTNQEAITIIGNLEDKDMLFNPCDVQETKTMTIKALTALDKIRAEIETIIGEYNLDDYDYCSGLICARNIIDKCKAESEE